MYKYLKKALIILYIIINLIYPSLIYAETSDAYDDSDWYKLWDRTEDTFLKELEEDYNPKYCSKKQKIIDGSVTWYDEIFGENEKEHYSDFDLADFCRGGYLTED